MSVFDIDERAMLVSAIDKRVKESITKEIAIVAQKNEIEVQQTKALTSLAEGVNAIAAFLTRGGLTDVLSGYARSQAVKDILGGLAAHDGRNALDSRVLGQNAIEIVHQVEAVFEKYGERLKEKGKRDPELHDGEAEFKEFEEKQKCQQKQES